MKKSCCRYLQRQVLVLAGAAIAQLAVVPALAGTDGFDLGLEDALPAAPPRTAPPAIAENPAGSDPTIRRDWYEPPGFDDVSYPRRLGRDLGAMVLAPIEWQGSDWRKLGLGIALIGAVSLLDKPVNSWLDEHRQDSWVSAAEGIRPLGQEGAFVLLGGAWLIGRNFDKPRLVAVAEDGFEAALFAAGVITPVLKAISGRARPHSTDDNGQLNGSNKSFPSGESTLAFAVASVIAAHSESWWVDVTAWTVAGLVGVQRMVLDAHWASDVVAGALIGAAVGNWVVRRNNPERDSRWQTTVMPIIAEDRYGLALHMKF